MLFALAVVLASARFAQASDAVVSDSVHVERLHLSATTHRALLAALAGGRGSSSAFGDRARTVVLAALDSERAACLAAATDDEARSKVWLDWRTLQSVEGAASRGFVAAVGCVDTLCGPEPMRRERLAYLSVGREHSELTLVGEPPSAHDAYERVSVDSIAILAGEGSVLIQARRRFDNDHPCMGVVDSHAFEEDLFVVLEDDRVRQAFALVPNGEWGSHDDEAGDAALTRRGELRVAPDRVELRYRLEEVTAPRSGDSAKPSVAVIGRGVVHMLRDAKTGRFVRSN